MTCCFKLTDPIAKDLKQEVGSGSFSTDVSNTDFFVFFLDIDEQGIPHVLGQPGKARTAFVFDRGLASDSTYKVSIPMFPVAHEFQRGHRIGLVLRSEWFPRYVRNLNTMEPQSSGTDIRVAMQKIHVGGLQSSRLLLPVAPQTLNSR